MKTLILLCALLTVASLRTYTKCELARTLRDYGLNGYRRHSLESLVCLVQHESSYRTDAVNPNRRGGKTVSSDYGLFQINSKWWCDDGMTRNSHNGCNKNCADFLDDDILDDVQCAKLMMKNPLGQQTWYGWVNNCRGDLSSFLRECGL